MKDRRQLGTKRVKMTPSPEAKRRSKAHAEPDQTETDPGYYTPDGSFVALPACPRTTPKRNTG
jgi:hypothetical protein